MRDSFLIVLADCDISEASIIHIHRVREDDAVRIDIDGVLIKLVFNQSGDEVIDSGDRVKVSIEVKIDIIFRIERGFSTACSSAFHAENWA